MPPLSPFNRTCLALAIGQLVALPAQAATITVDSTVDPGAGAGNNDGICTLREAIASANSEGGGDPGNNCAAPSNGADTIVFAPTLAGQTVTLNGTQLELNSESTIDGSAADPMTISGNAQSRVLSINSAMVRLDSLTVTGGSTGDSGGGIFFNGGGTLTLNDLTIEGNTAKNGGGIYVQNLSSGSLSNVTISSNSAYRNGGGIIVDTSSNVSLTNVTISSNSAGYAAGGFWPIGTDNISLTNVTISDNFGGRFGGGIQPNSSQSLSLMNSTVSNNTAKYGGGINVTDSNISLTNSTVSHNTAVGSSGGISTFISVVHLANTTVSNNTASSGAGGIGAGYYALVSLANSTVSGNTAVSKGGGGISVAGDGATVSLANSIISGNTAEMGAEIYKGTVYSYANSLITHDSNLFGDNSKTFTAAFFDFTPSPNDINATQNDSGGDHQPMALSGILKPLSDNGCTLMAGASDSAGCVNTHALAPGSPAIDVGDQGFCLANQITTDQRGKVRDKFCDIGAFEFIDDQACFVINGSGGKVVVFCL